MKKLIAVFVIIFISLAACAENTAYTGRTTPLIFKTELITLPSKCIVQEINGSAQVAILYSKGGYRKLNVGDVIGASHIMIVSKNTRVSLADAEKKLLYLYGHEQDAVYTFDLQ